MATLLELVKAERDKLNKVIALLEGKTTTPERSSGPVPMSAATKAKISRKLKATWAAKKANSKKH